MKGGSVLTMLSRLLGDVVTRWVFLGSLCRRMGWPLPAPPSAGGVTAGTPFSQLALLGNLFPNRAG